MINFIIFEKKTKKNVDKHGQSDGPFPAPPHPALRLKVSTAAVCAVKYFFLERMKHIPNSDANTIN